MTARENWLFVGPDDGFRLTNPIGGKMVLRATDEATRGAYSLPEYVLPPQSAGPRPHIHHSHEEAFYVLGGEPTMRAGTRMIKAQAGSFAAVPRGVVHQPSNPLEEFLPEHRAEGTEGQV